MKTFFFIVPIFILVLFSCKKEDDSEVSPTVNSHRIKSELSVNNFDIALAAELSMPETTNTSLKSQCLPPEMPYRIKTDYFYSGENISERITYEEDGDENWLESFKSVYSYNGNTVIESGFSRVNDDWEMTTKKEYIVIGGLLQEILIYLQEEDVFVEYQKKVFKYAGSNLISYEEFLYEDGRFISNYKIDFAYSGNKISEQRQYIYEGKWKLLRKLSFSYIGNNLSEYINFEYTAPDTWEETIKCEYVYTGGYVSNIISYYPVPAIESNEGSNESFIEGDIDLEYKLLRTDTYEHNSEGYLLSDNVGGRSTFYEYEEGNGNASVFNWKSQPQIAVFSRPTLKSLKHSCDLE